MPSLTDGHHAAGGVIGPNGQTMAAAGASPGGIAAGSPGGGGVSAGGGQIKAAGVNDECE